MHTLRSLSRADSVCLDFSCTLSNLQMNESQQWCQNAHRPFLNFGDGGLKLPGVRTQRALLSKQLQPLLIAKHSHGLVIEGARRGTFCSSSSADISSVGDDAVGRNGRIADILT